MATSTKDRQAVDKIRQLLHRRFKVHLKGGRILSGDFTCLDPQGNLILSNACELVANGDKQLATERPMGMVLVLKNQQEKVFMQVSLAERMDKMALTSTA